MQTQPRNRPLYALLMIVVIVLGLASRHWRHLLPAILQKNAGDGLWALMVFVLLGFLFPTRSTAWTASIAAIISACDEFSQAYHTPSLDAIRATTLGHLILGSDFAWTDMLDYAIGILIGAALEIAWQQYRFRHPKISVRSSTN
jgi:uncharacterized membrane protein YccC